MLPRYSDSDTYRISDPQPHDSVLPASQKELFEKSLQKISWITTYLKALNSEGNECKTDNIILLKQ